MSRVHARMAISNRTPQLLRMTAFGIALGVSIGQSNGLRAQTIGSGVKFSEPSTPSMSLQVRSTSGRWAKALHQDPPTGTNSEGRPIDYSNESPLTTDNAAAEAATQSPSDKKLREPIVVPNLTIPNISVSGIGTGTTPEDAVAGRLPAPVALPYGPDRQGMWILQNKTWVAPVFCHQPLYFEDIMLERHGHERLPPLQPILSGVRFFTTIATQPYLAYLNPPFRESYNTGNYRPGSAAPGLRQRAPYDKGAMRFQLLTTGTTVLAFQP